jgi:TetR/AcrR family transcriptional regulator, transcriptional repressor of bet genes
MTASRPGPRFTRLSSDDRRTQLIDTGLACMAGGGIEAFTVDRICAAAGCSRGLIVHHFGSMNGLLAAVYARVYRDTTPDLSQVDPPEARLTALIDGVLAPAVFNRDMINIWITLWGQISNNPTMRDEHRRLYAAYLDQVEAAIAAQASAQGRKVAARSLAKSLICLLDGLSLQHCLDPEAMPAAEAAAACRAYLAPHLGPMAGQPGQPEVNKP